MSEAKNAVPPTGELERVVMCDCLNCCGDDPWIAQKKAQPCENYKVRMRKSEMAKELDIDDVCDGHPVAMAELKRLREIAEQPHSKREYKLAYIEGGKRHYCGQAETIESAEKLRAERAETFAPLEVVILEKETVCREIRYT